jgi:hypothetical protein
MDMILPLLNTTALREQLGPLCLGEPFCRVGRARRHASSEPMGLSPFAGDVFRKGGERVASVISRADLALWRSRLKTPAAMS